MPFELVRDDLYVQFKLPPLCYVSSTRFFFPTSKCTSMNTPYKMFPVFFFWELLGYALPKEQIHTNSWRGTEFKMTD